MRLYACKKTGSMMRSALQEQADLRQNATQKSVVISLFFAISNNQLCAQMMCVESRQFAFLWITCQHLFGIFKNFSE